MRTMFCLAMLYLAIAGSVVLASFSVPPAAWAETTADRAVELYQEGQDALSNDQYTEAVEAFREARQQSTEPGLTSEILYWLAFSLYRQRGAENLAEAEALLAELLETAPDTATRQDAAELLTRIRGIRARQGDALAAARIALMAQEKHLAQEQARLTAEEHLAREETRLAVEARRAQAEAREAAREILLRRAESEAESLALRQVLGLPALFGDGTPDVADDDIRIAALNALARTDPQRALPILREVLARRDPGSEKLRRVAIFVLARFETPAAADLILAAAREDPDPTVRGRAIHYLGLLGSDEALGVIEEALADNRAPEVQERAVAALTLLDPELATPLLQRVVRDKDLDLWLRDRIIHALAIRDDAHNVAFLRELFGQLEDPSLKTTVVMAVGQASRPESRDWLLEVIRDSAQPRTAREQGLFWLATDTNVSTEQLVALYDSLESPELRRHAVLVIGRREDPAAMDFILRIAQDDSDPEIQRAAILWLGQSRDPRAVGVLEKLLRR